MYFFSNKEAKYRNGNRANRKTCSGYWKATGSDKKIVSSTMKHIVGTRKTLVFYRGKPPHGSRTDWFMHEYSLVHVETKSCSDIFPQVKKYILYNLFVGEKKVSISSKMIVQIFYLFILFVCVICRFLKAKLKIGFSAAYF